MPSPRAAVAAGLGAALLVGVGGTWAHWTDAVAVSGTTLTAGTLDLRVDDADAVTTSTLAMAAMVPGSSSAQVLTLRNAGSAPLSWTVTGNLGGTDAAAFAAASAVRIRLVTGGTRTGTGSAATCTGGTDLLGPTALTAAPGTVLVGTRQGPLAAAGTGTLCVELSLAAAAPSSLQGRTATVTLGVGASTESP